jgi:hypothetical protein
MVEAQSRHGVQFPVRFAQHYAAALTHFANACEWHAERADEIGVYHFGGACAGRETQLIIIAATKRERQRSLRATQCGGGVKG